MTSNARCNQTIFHEYVLYETIDFKAKHKFVNIVYRSRINYFDEKRNIQIVRTPIRRNFFFVTKPNRRLVSHDVSARTGELWQQRKQT